MEKEERENEKSQVKRRKIFNEVNREILEEHQKSLDFYLMNKGILNIHSLNNEDRNCFQRSVNSVIFATVLTENLKKSKQCKDCTTFSEKCKKCISIVSTAFYKIGSNPEYWEQFNEKEIWKGFDCSKEAADSVSWLEETQGFYFNIFTEGQYGVTTIYTSTVKKSQKTTKTQNYKKPVVNLFLQEDKLMKHYCSVQNVHQLLKAKKGGGNRGNKTEIFCPLCLQRFWPDTHRRDQDDSPRWIIKESIFFKGPVLRGNTSYGQYYNDHLNDCKGRIQKEVFPAHKYCKPKNKFGSILPALTIYSGKKYLFYNMLLTLIFSDFETKKTKVAKLCLRCRRISDEMLSSEDKQQLATICKESKHRLPPISCSNCSLDFEVQTSNGCSHDIETCDSCWDVLKASVNCTHSMTDNGGLMEPCAFSITCILNKVPNSPHHPPTVHSECYDEDDNPRSLMTRWWNEIYSISEKMQTDYVSMKTPMLDLTQEEELQHNRTKRCGECNKWFGSRINGIEVLKVRGEIPTQNLSFLQLY